MLKRFIVGAISVWIILAIIYAILSTPEIAQAIAVFAIIVVVSTLGGLVAMILTKDW